MTGRSTCTPPGSVAVSTPKSTTPNLRTGRRFEAIVNQECARRASHASANCGRCANGRLSKSARFNMSRVRIPIYFDYASTLCYIAWRIVSRARRRTRFRGAVEGRADRDARFSRQARPRAGRARAAESAVRRGGDGHPRRAAVELDRFDSRAAGIGSRARCGRLPGVSRRGLSRGVRRRRRYRGSRGARRDCAARRPRSIGVSRGARQRRDERAPRPSTSARPTSFPRSATRPLSWATFR